MSFHDCDRFHRAARDGYLDLLHEGNRKELNAHDEDGMTPAMWAAYYGHLDALRLIVGRGGDPDKCDFYGNTPLHCAAGNGHINCVSFLINFGVNLWALDNDFHTAKDVSVLNRREDCLRLLDQAQAKHALINKKLVQRLKEKSIADAEKRIKNYRKLQMKALRKAEKEEKLLERQRRKYCELNKELSLSESSLAAFRRDSKFICAPKFSDIVHGNTEKKTRTTIFKKPAQSQLQHQRKKKGVEFRLDHSEDADHSTDNGSSTTVSIESKESDCDPSRDSNPDTSTITDINESESSTEDTSSDFHHTTDSGIGDELPVPESIVFDGYSTRSSRSTSTNNGYRSRLSRNSPGGCNSNHSTADMEQRSFTSTLQAVDDRDDDTIVVESTIKCQRTINRNSVIAKNHSVNDSIGSASSLVRRHITWEDEYENDVEVHRERTVANDSVEEEADVEPVTIFLSSLGLSEYSPLFLAEKIDLEALSLLSEDDFKTLGMPLGPRRKLEKALERRRKAFEEPGTVQDSKL